MKAAGTLRLTAGLLFLIGGAVAQEHISYPTSDGGLIQADSYGKGDRAVVLVHGGRFNKESWRKQAETLVGAGFHVVAIDMRGYGQSHGPGQADLYTAPLYLDILAAVHCLRKEGAKSVSVVGASIGGSAAGKASIESAPGEIDRLVVLAGWTDGPPEKLKGRKLFIVARDDANDDGPRLPKVRANYEQATEPKKLVILDGSAHAQFLFETDQGQRLMHEILTFLSEP